MKLFLIACVALSTSAFAVTTVVPPKTKIPTTVPAPTTSHMDQTPIKQLDGNQEALKGVKTSHADTVNDTGDIKIKE